MPSAKCQVPSAKCQVPSNYEYLNSRVKYPRRKNLAISVRQVGQLLALSYWLLAFLFEIITLSFTPLLACISLQVFLSKLIVILQNKLLTAKSQQLIASLTPKTQHPTPYTTLLSSLPVKSRRFTRALIADTYIFSFNRRIFYEKIFV